MTTGTILKEDRVSSTIHNVNKYLRMATHQINVKKCESDYFVMTGNTVEEIINSYQNKAAKTALMVDDLGLQVINRLYQEGLKKVTLCLARIPADQMDMVKFIITSTFPDIKVDIIHSDDINDKMTFDLVISNPPYGTPGANITKKLIDTVDFKEFINLLPANDYKRNTDKDLFNYQSDMRPAAAAGERAFSDATVTTHIAKIHKNKVNNMTIDEFEISNYTDNSLFKYFTENRKRKHYAIEKDSFCNHCRDYSNELTVIMGWRDINHKAMPKSTSATTYKWNVEKSIDGNYVLANHEKVTHGEHTGRVSFGGITFKTPIEKDNFVTLFYSDKGRYFIYRLWSSMNVDGGLFTDKWFPKVDWTRSWTVEEILADYGYTEDEIQEVMEDLKNFKGMED